MIVSGRPVRGHFKDGGSFSAYSYYINTAFKRMIKGATQEASKSHSVVSKKVIRVGGRKDEGRDDGNVCWGRVNEEGGVEMCHMSPDALTHTNAHTLMHTHTHTYTQMPRTKLIHGVTFRRRRCPRR